MSKLMYMDEDYTGFGEMNVQSDWNQSDSTKDDYIKNKPTGLLKSKVLTYNSSITVPNKNAAYPWSVAVFTNVLSAGETFVGAFFYLNVSGEKDGFGGTVIYNDQENKVTAVLTNAYSSDQTIAAGQLCVTVLYI